MTGIQLTIQGEESAFRLGRRYIAKGAKGLGAEMHRAMREATTGLEAEVRRSAYRLPNRNGLADEVASSRISLAYSLGRTNAGVTVTARHRYHLAGLDAGRNVHPLFGNRGHWYSQWVRPGWFTEPVEGRADEVGEALRRAVKRYIAEL